MQTATTTQQSPRRARSRSAFARLLLVLATAVAAPCLGLASGCAAGRSCVLRAPNAELQARAHDLLARGQATSDPAGDAGLQPPTVTP